MRSAGAGITSQSQSTTVPTNYKSFYSLKIRGKASVTTVNIGQRLEANLIRRLRRQLVFSAWIYNDTGGAFTPKLQIVTPTASDTWSGVNVAALDQALSSCANGAWTRVCFSFDPTAYTDIVNGAELSIQIPSGSLDADTKYVYVTQFQLEEGRLVTDFDVVEGALRFANSQVASNQVVTRIVSEGYLAQRSL